MTRLMRLALCRLRLRPHTWILRNTKQDWFLWCPECRRRTVGVDITPKPTIRFKWLTSKSRSAAKR